MSTTNQRHFKTDYIDGITFPACINVNNWIELTKQKLQVRENKGLSTKISEIEKIVNEQLVLLFNPFIYRINDMIKHIINTSISAAIQKWPGVDAYRTKKRKLQRFEDYFFIGKNWWDLRKQKLIATSFFIVIFKDIQKVRNIQTLQLLSFITYTLW